jgi:hypothetical protein
MRILNLAAVGLLTACGAAGPASYMAPVLQGGSGDGYSCAFREVNEMGFTVVDADRSSGFLVAEKQTTGALETLFGSPHEFDRLTVTVYDDGIGGQTMRVTAGQSTRPVEPGDGSESPTPTARQAAQQLLQACSTGEIREQGLEENGSGYEARV